ncbi:MAG: bifunctional response regulator/alkaline phosphatase family protein [Candidatus Kapabacteria bacterium]|nr:bifunctional response regulator/alkaline phosphatase family protein [Candidatus Kapabacteria bacterium]
MNNILWVDDEIDLLRPHIILLEGRGYKVSTATNGEDAIEMAQNQRFDLIFLDESMVGISGLETLVVLKDIDRSVPIVMVTKNEQESLMEEAIGKKINDYLTKPVNPTQILAACKKFLETQRITEEKITQDFHQEYSVLSRRLMDRMDWSEWLDVYLKLTERSIELDKHQDVGLEQSLRDQWKVCNAEFSKFVEHDYFDWLVDKDKRPDGAPLLSPHVADSFLIPKLASGRPTFFIVVDCMRLDQWLVMEEFIRPLFNIQHDYYCSILPTATPYARNSIFAGLYPTEINKHYPQFTIDERGSDEHSLNKHEKEFLSLLLQRRRVKLKNDLQYIKIIDTDFGKKIESDIMRYAKHHLTAIVINAVDMIAHSRSDYPILKEIAPDESAYRSLTRSWFLHSSFYGILKALANVPDIQIVITTDHGSVRCMRPSKVIGDRETTSNLRYKIGRNVKAESRDAMIIKDPQAYRIPAGGGSNTSVIVSKEDHYFIYPTDYNHYVQKYRDSFQHGGISLEEMVLPVVTLEPR